MTIGFSWQLPFGGFRELGSSVGAMLTIVPRCLPNTHGGHDPSGQEVLDTRLTMCYNWAVMLTTKGCLLTLLIAIATITPTADSDGKADSTQTAPLALSIRMLQRDFVLGEEVFVEVTLTKLHNRKSYAPYLYLSTKFLEFDLRCNGDSLIAPFFQITAGRSGGPEWNQGESVIDTLGLSWFYGEHKDERDLTRILPPGRYTAKAVYHERISSNTTEFTINEPTPRQQAAFGFFLAALRALEEGNAGQFQKSCHRLLAQPECYLYLNRLLDVSSTRVASFEPSDQAAVASDLHLLVLRSGHFGRRGGTLRFYQVIPTGTRRALLDELNTAWPEAGRTREFRTLWDLE